jgi:hypothetical protein
MHGLKVQVVYSPGQVLGKSAFVRHHQSRLEFAETATINFVECVTMICPHVACAVFRLLAAWSC